jgi:uncharacterized protein (TIGR02466 family)
MPIENWFPTPIYFNMVEDIDKVQQEFTTLVEESSFDKREGWDRHTHKLNDTSFKKSYMDKVPTFEKQLKKHVYTYMENVEQDFDSVKDYTVTASWLTLTGPGEYAHNHSHGSADISGVYYVQTNGQDGSIFFNTPNSVLSHSYAFGRMLSTCYYKPQVGKILLFPGWLEHGVQVNDTDGFRISFSFNIVFDRVF